MSSRFIPRSIRIGATALPRVAILILTFVGGAMRGADEKFDFNTLRARAQALASQP
jgi:hypothetical protein